MYSFLSSFKNRGKGNKKGVKQTESGNQFFKYLKINFLLIQIYSRVFHAHFSANSNK